MQTLDLVMHGEKAKLTCAIGQLRCGVAICWQHHGHRRERLQQAEQRAVADPSARAGTASSRRGGCPGWPAPGRACGWLRHLQRQPLVGLQRRCLHERALRGRFPCRLARRRLRLLRPLRRLVPAVGAGAQRRSGCLSWRHAAGAGHRCCCCSCGGRLGSERLRRHPALPVSHVFQLPLQPCCWHGPVCMQQRQQIPS